MIKIIPAQKNINATISIPSSKSLTNRAFILASLADGTSTIGNPLLSDDTKIMLKALKQLGVKIKKKNNIYEIYGTKGKFHKPKKELFLGNAGTATRFLLGILSLNAFSTTITGDSRMEERPIKDLASALKKLGSTIKFLKKKCFIPLNISGPLLGGTTRLDASISSQFLSALLLAAPYAQKPVTIELKGKMTSKPYIDLTLEIMEYFGVKVNKKDEKKFTIQPQTYKSKKYSGEGDASSATYPFALAAIHKGKMTITNLSPESKQADIKFLNVLKKMGCKISKEKNGIHVENHGQLKALGNIDLNDLPDAAMTVAILCCFAPGISTLKNIGNLRVKESDRLAALTKELRKIGAKVKEGKDYLRIDGHPENLHGGLIETYNDHRIAMCFAIVGSKIPNIIIKNPECVSKTYPTFWKDLKKWGVNHQIMRQKRGKKNIVLGGLRGTGKSTLGKILAQKMGYKFLDTDELIEKKTGMKIIDLVAKKGWPTFRNLEHEVCKEIAEVGETVISTGGGIFLDPKNRKLLKKNGFVIILTCNTKTSAKRIQKSYQRPSLTKRKNEQEEIEQLWRERKEIYAEVGDFFFDTREENGDFEKDLATKVEKLIAFLKKIKF